MHEPSYVGLLRRGHGLRLHDGEGAVGEPAVGEGIAERVEHDHVSSSTPIGLR
jgi:hypothetical protein